jgi:Putative multicopper oxidases
MPWSFRPLLRGAWLVSALAAATPAPRPNAAPTLAITNDNTKPAGRLDSTTLSISLELRDAAWQPGGPNTRSIRVFAFGEAGHAPSVPGPLIRAGAGTTVQVSLANRLDRRAVVYGFHDHDGHADSVILAPGETRRLSYRARSPGTFFYRARTTVDAKSIGRTEDSQLAGALVVDAPGESARAHERVMVVTAFDDTAKAAGYPDDHFQVFAINGLSWPRTEALTYSIGDTVTWRVVNASAHAHPMHLHGFHYVVEARGYELADTAFAAGDRRLAVTELLRTTATMRVSWVASRPGNWLFHCHLIQHIATSLRLDHDARGRAMPHDHAQDVMSGLVVAVRVRGTVPPPPLTPTAASPRQHLHLFVTERQTNTGTAMSYVLQDGDVRPSADSVRRPGATIEVQQGQPTDIVVTNLAHRETAVHWHGLELDSYYDGVAGWSGIGTIVAPAIAAGDSFVARITPPRAGTFIYHTHVDELTQLPAGLFGAFIVLPKGMSHRDTTERLLFLTDDGLDGGSETGGSPSDSTTILLRAGVTHRLRIISIGTEATYRIRLLSDSTVVTWRPVAKDGADLPASLSVESPAMVLMGAGETLDVAVRRDRPGRLTLELRKDGVTYYRVPVVMR